MSVARAVVTDRVYWSDVDKMDVMFYAKYLRFMERAESAFFRAHGWTYDDIGRDFGIWLARVHVSVDFRRPARLDDELTAWAELTKIGGSSLHFAFPIERDATRMADGKLVLAALDRDSLKAVRLPAALVRQLGGRDGGDPSTRSG